MIGLRERIVGTLKRRRRVLTVLAVYGGLAAAGEMFIPAQAVPVPLPVYEIEAISGTHEVKLIGNLGYPGALQAPIPVDVDEDIIPDVLVSVNLINPEGIIQNPPDLGDVLAPNIVIDRALSGIPLDKSSPPLRINVKLTIRDVLGDQPDMILRFGYDTAQGGSIPSTFKAVVGGLDEFFNPLEAVIDTKGGTQGADSPFVWYEGPLTVVAGLEQGDFKADAELAYRPFPDAVRVTYASDDAGQHITYAHGIGNEVHLKYGTDVNGSNVKYVPGELPEVDLTTTLKVLQGDEALDLKARVDRLPRSIALDLASASDGGSVDYRASSDGRLPDVRVDIGQKSPGAKPLNALVKIEDLPQRMHGEWSLPADGTVHAAFSSSGQGIGAIEALVTDFDGAPTLLQKYVPLEQQYLNFQQASGPGDASERIISGRVERIRAAEASFEPDGSFEGTLQIGDGERPLLAHVLLDDSAAGGELIEATSTVAPLPDDIDIAFRPGTAGSKTDPLRFTYDASESVDVDATARLVEAGTASSAPCGEPGTICATLKARHLPTHIEARLFDFEAGGTDESRIEVDAIPRPGGAKPDLFADAIIGQEDDLPLVAHAEVLGLPPFLRARAVEGEGETLERVEFHSCDRLFDQAVPSCAPGTDIPIGELKFSVRNFIDRATTNVPPAVPETPLYATIVGRGMPAPSTDVLFEATARLTDISEVQYLNKGVFGVRTRVGANKDLSAHIDVRDVNLLGDELGVVDTIADARVTPLPGTFDACFRRSGLDLVPLPTTPFTAPCETSQPFEDLTLGTSPTSFAFRAETPFDVEARAAIRFHDSLEAVNPATGAPDPAGTPDDQFIRGYLKLDNVPASLTTHVLTPEKDTDGPIRVLHDAPAGAQCETLPCTGQVNIDFSAELTDGDLECEDPRLAAAKRQALCVSGRVENLPTKVDFRYDPTLADQQLKLDTEGDEKINLKNLRFSMVKRAKDADGNYVAVPDVIVADGQVVGLPRDVVGTINLPASIQVRADPIGDPEAMIDQIDATVRNFIVPDPMPTSEPARTVRPGLTITPGNPAIQKVVVFGRKDTDTDRLLFKAIAHITDVIGFGYRTQTDAAGNLLDTKVIDVDFGRNKTVRAYADVDTGTQRLIGDVTLPNTPAGITLCFRGAKEATGGAPTVPVYCDDAPMNDDQGAFQFVQRPNPPVGELDVHAYARYATAGGADVLSGRVDVINIPKVVQGTFGDGTADVGGFEELDGDGNGMTPDGIDKIGFNLASFDITNTGYADPDFDLRTKDGDPFPAVTTPRQHVGLAADDTDFELVGSIGSVEGSGIPGSDLQRVFVSDVPCGRPVGAGARPDFPFYPPNPAAPADPIFSYTCARAEFEQVGGDVDPLDLNAVIEQGGKRLALHDAGLTEIPAFFQLNLAKTETLSLQNVSDPDRPFRPICKAAAPSTFPTQDPSQDCLPPFVRMDTPGNSTLFGVLEAGTEDDLADLADVERRAALADVDAAPGECGAGWSDWGSVDCANPIAGPKGIRVKVGLGSVGLSGADTSRLAVKAGVRLQIPPSLTIEQIRSWSHSKATTPKADNHYDASDLIIRAVVRNPDGTRQTSLGKLTGLIHSFADGDQVLLSDAGDSEDGINIPGDFGLGMYMRDAKGKGRNFIQVDGRISAPINAHARIISDAGTNVDAKILNVPVAETDAPFADSPSFRLRAEIDGDPQDPPPPGSGSSGGGGSGGDPPKEDSCSILYCLETQVRLKQVSALFDFDPSGPNADPGPARLLEAAIRTGGIKNGLQVKGWTEVDGGDPTPFTARGDVLVQPINVFLHAGIPVIGSLDFVLLSDLAAGVRIENTHDFTLRQNILHVTASSPGSSPFGGGEITFPCLGFSCLYVDYRIYQLHGLAFSILGLLWGNPVLLGVDYLPPSLPRDVFAPTVNGINTNPFDPTSVPVDFRDCNTLGITGTTNILPINPVTGSNVVVWPDLDRLIFYGTLGPLFEGGKLIADLVAPVFCFFPADADEIPLIEGSAPGAADRTPGNPLNFAGHPVPDTVSSTTSSTTPPQPNPEPLNVSGTLALCGNRVFNSVTVPSGATLSVATAADASDLIVNGKNLGDKCAAGNESNLHIVAAGTDGDDPNNGDIVIGGTVNAAPGSGGELSLTGMDVIVQSTGAVHGGRGELRLAAADDVTVAGEVEADAVWTTIPPGGSTPTGNSGGGHGGKGGDGSSGTGGAKFGDESFTAVDGVVQTEGGTRGAGTNPGDGGGELTLIGGDRVVISGTVSANATKGASSTSGSCAVPDDPNVDGDQSQPNTGSPGSGGGSGGGMVISAPGVDITATGVVRARGGDGGAGKAGGGGGGSGGRIKVKSPLFSDSVDVSGGDGGDSGCPADFDPGDDGPDEQFLHDKEPVSSALPFEFFWQRGTPLPISYSAGARVSDSGGDDFNVVLCGVYAAPGRPDQDGGDGGDEPDGLTQSLTELMPPASSVDFDSPCGEFPFFDPRPDPTQLGSEFLENRTRQPSGATIDADLPVPPNAKANGFWGVWTTVIKPESDGNDCFDHDGLSEILFDLGDCTVVETLPATPETAFGYDNNRPTFGFSTGVSATNPDGIKVTGSKLISLSIDNADDSMADKPLSGITGFQCGNNPPGPGGTKFIPCQEGTFSWTLPDEEGKTAVTAEAFDHAGNVSDVDPIEVVLDLTAPSSSGAPASLPNKNNGWYSTSPDFLLDNFSDPDLPDGAKGAGFGKFEFRFDEGPVRSCADNPCTIDDDLPGEGRHTLEWWTLDAVGNKSKAKKLAVKIDHSSPLSAFSTVPAAPNGANDWFTKPTWGAISTFDRPPGGSGLKIKPGDPPSDGNPFGVFFGIDGPAVTPYTDPFPIPPGSHSVCWKAIDVAGNTDGEQCTPEPVQVDLAPPDVTIVASPIAPDGLNGWYTSQPSVRIVSSDTTPGSGVNQSFDPDLSDLCTGRPLKPNPAEKAPSGTCVSVDGAPYTPYIGSFSIPEGVHGVRAFAVDVSGQRSEVEELILRVDLSDPVPTARFFGPQPAANGWWRAPVRVTLRAVDGDQNAGISFIEYRIDGGFFNVYTEPFEIPSGVHALEYRARDLAGRVAALRTVQVPVDVISPAVKATKPEPLVWIKILGPSKAKLKWELSDDLSGPVRVFVIVYDQFGFAVRRIDGGVQTATPGVTLSGFTYWDGTDQSLLGFVGIGIYHYRVVAIDQAGNPAMSGESHPLQIKLL